MSATSGAGISATNVSLYKVKFLGVVAGAGVTKVVTDMDLFKSATGQTLTYLSASVFPVAKQAPAAALLIAGYMNVAAGAGASASVTMNVRRALFANANATAIAFDTGFFSNAYMSVGAIAQATIKVGFQNQRGLSVNASATAATSSSNPDVQRLRSLAASASATASSSNAAIGFVWSLSANGTATASINSPPPIFKLKFLNVTSRAEADASVDLAMNIFAPAPSARIISVPYTPRVVYAPYAPRYPLVEPH
jgi:hypothetical protein